MTLLEAAVQGNSVMRRNPICSRPPWRLAGPPWCVYHRADGPASTDLVRKAVLGDAAAKAQLQTIDTEVRQLQSSD
jgi:hypothetical protein